MSSLNHDSSDKKTETWEFCLYIHGDSPRSKKAIDQVEQVCRRYLAGRYRLEYIDLLKTPERASEENIMATPTLVKRTPPPKKILGDFSNAKQVLEILGLKD